MAAGEKKDASYIASIVEKHAEHLDPSKQVLDLIFFDGASNVQKAGQIIEAKYPRATCLHGIEHKVSLFFSDLASVTVVKVCA